MPRTLRVLLVEDNEDDAELLRRSLRREIDDLELHRVETSEGMSAALTLKKWDVVLSDFTMPRFSGMDALALLKSRALDIPFIFISGTIGEDVAVNAMRRGASDYFLKGNTTRLVPAIERELRERDGRIARRRAEHELRRSEERYDALFDIAPVPMWVFDRESLAFLAVNSAAIRHYGYTRSEFMKFTLADIRPPEDVSTLRDHLDHLSAQDLGSTWRHRKKDGSIILVEIKAHDLEFAGRLARLVSVNDVTQRVQAGEALRSKDEQLRQSQKMEVVGRLAGGVAHDFNNLLSVILSYSEMIIGTLSDSDPLRGDLEEIRDAGTRAAELTKQLLLFSRQQVLEARVLDLNELVAGMGKMLRRILGEDVELRVLTAASPARLRANPGHIEQVVLNLVVNARDAMPTGGKLIIDISNVVLDGAGAPGPLPVAPGPYVQLAVTDTGTGMDKATEARVFEPFFTTKERGKGTGLGLSTVFGIAQSTGGSVSVSSETGRGTTFNVYFPRVDAPVEPAGTTLSPPTLRGTETILLVEDEESVRTVVKSILGRHGYRVLEARSHDDAVALCKDCEGHPQIHLLLSDVVMPKMSGIELSRLLTRDRPRMRVLCMSGYTDDSVVRHGVLDANVAFLQKPITPESLTRKVREVLDRVAP